MAWTSAQQTALAVTPKISSVLSLFGSTWILIEVLWGKVDPNQGNKNQRRSTRGIHQNHHSLKRHHPYHRLLLAMSVYDILESVWNFASTWPLPADEPIDARELLQPVGTTQTCTAQGFFLTLSVAVPIYNAFLSLYYLLVINYRCTDTYIRKWIEPTMHLVAFVWAFGTALSSAVMGLLNNANLWCWIAPYPSNCLSGDDVECTRGQNAFLFRWVFYFGPLWICILASTIFTLWVYAYVRRIDMKSLQYRSHTREESRYSSHTSGHMNVSGQNQCFADTAPVSLRLSMNRKVSETTAGNRQNMRLSFLGASVRFGGTSTLGLETNDANTENKEEDVDPRESPHRQLTADEVETDRKERFLKRGRTQRQEEQRKANRRSVEVFHQACLYLLCFYCTHIWSTSNRIVQQLNGGSTVYGLILLHSFFDPFQGFLNYFVYQRPRYLRIHKDNPNISRWDALKQVLRFSFMPQLDTKDTESSSSDVPPQSPMQDASSDSISVVKVGTKPSNLLVMSLASELEPPIQEYENDGDELETIGDRERLSVPDCVPDHEALLQTGQDRREESYAGDDTGLVDNDSDVMKTWPPPSLDAQSPSSPGEAHEWKRDGNLIHAVLQRGSSIDEEGSDGIAHSTA